MKFLLSFFLPALAFLLLLLSSCLSLHTDIRLRKNNSLRVSLYYELSPEFADFGRGFGADEPWPLPLRERDFRQRAWGDPAIHVHRYTSKTDKKGREKIEVEIDAVNVEALARYLNVNLSLEGDSQSGVFRYGLQENMPFKTGSLSSENRSIFLALAGDSQVSFRFTPPHKPSAVEPGRIEKRTAIWDFPLARLIDTDLPLEWRVSW